MSKITLPTVASGYNLSVINSNFQAIEDTLNDSVLFRDEDVSNEMSTNLDMNGFSIYNVNEIDSDAVTVGGVPLAEHIASLAVSFDPNDLTIARYVKTITIASTIVTLPETYGGTASSLMVFRNGVQQPSSHYTFDGSNITFSDILGVGEVVDVVYFKSIVSAIGAAEIGDVSGLTEALNAKQATLVSGVNIRTINGNNILGGGDLSVGAGTVTSVAATVPTGLTITGSPITSSGTLAIGLDTGYSIPTTTKQSEWDAKQAALVSGTNIKTINGSSVLGSGNLVVAGTGDVVGPASSTDNTLPRFDGTTGKLLQGSGVVVDDSNRLSGGSYTATNALATVATDGAHVDYSVALARFIAGRAGGNYATWEAWVAGASGVTKRYSIGFDGLTKWFAADGTTERMTLDASGRIGLGRTPTYALDVANVASGGFVKFGDGTNEFAAYLSGGRFYLGPIASSSLALITNNAERMLFDTSGNITVTSGAFGYGAGAGGTGTVVSNAVTINKPSGQINVPAASIAAGAVRTVRLTNSFIAGVDVVVAGFLFGYGTGGSYTLTTQTGTGFVDLHIRNETAGALNEQHYIEFGILKVSTS